MSGIFKVGQLVTPVDWFAKPRINPARVTPTVSLYVSSGLIFMSEVVVIGALFPGDVGLVVETAKSLGAVKIACSSGCGWADGALLQVVKETDDENVH